MARYFIQAVYAVCRGCGKGVDSSLSATATTVMNDGEEREEEDTGNDSGLPSVGNSERRLRRSQGHTPCERFCTPTALRMAKAINQTFIQRCSIRSTKNAPHAAEIKPLMTEKRERIRISILLLISARFFEQYHLTEIVSLGSILETKCSTEISHQARIQSTHTLRQTFLTLILDTVWYLRLEQWRCFRACT